MARQPTKPKKIEEQMKRLKTRKGRIGLKSKEIKSKTKIGKFTFNG